MSSDSSSTQAPARARFVIVVDAERCKACGLCIDFCPADVLDFAAHLNSAGYHPVEPVRPEACTGCQSCVVMCPDVCIEIYRRAGDVGSQGVSANGGAGAPN